MSAKIFTQREDMNTPKEPITGEEVLNAFKADIESFFGSNNAFQLRVEVGGISPVCRGSGEKARIIWPKDLLTQPVNTSNDMVFLLIVLGHETAHYLNRHNEHNDQSSFESRAIEMWADFFGTKVALVAITIGEKLQRLSVALPDWDNSGKRIGALASALATLSATYFKIEHQKYPPARVRVATCVAGALSFFEVLFSIQAGAKGGYEGYLKASHPDTIVRRALEIQMRIYRNEVLNNLVIIPEPLDLNSEQLQTISAVHKGIQAGQRAMFCGMAPIPAAWLNLNYDVPEEQRQETVKNKMQVLKNTLERLGIDPSSVA